MNLRNFIILLLVAGCLGAGGYWYMHHNGGPAFSYRTTPTQRGELLATISATGTLEPEEVVDVGAQVAGQILTFGKDPNAAGKLIDYNSEVNEGSILAEIDSSLYQADVDQSRAQVESGKANIAKAQADLGQAKAKLLQAERDWKRAQDATKGVLSQADIDASESAYTAAQAAVSSADAGILLAQKNVIAAEVSLKRAERNLSYCTIKSPVKGVIIDRRVNIGQTVVSSLNAPSLFLIAKDLTKMQIWASVNEADIGHIRPGQTVSFTVDSVPGRTFHGSVGKIRLNATTTQNVVTYTVEINTDNSDRALKPYLTANVQFEVDKHDNVLMVPNAALRWAPTQQSQVSAETWSALNARLGRGGNKSTSGPSTRRSEGATKKYGQLWVMDGTFVKPVKVLLGLTDGTNTEVASEELSEGQAVVIGESKPEDAGAGGDAKNPFMPQFGNRRGAGGGGGGGRGG